jgi:hypothetical protein
VDRGRPATRDLTLGEGARISTITRDLERARSAFNKPTLSLLRQKWAPVILAVFTSHFTRERSRIAADRFHVQVETSLDELRRRGEDVPDGIPRDLCRRWVNQKWLSLSSNDAGVEEYALTSHAQSALDYVNSLSGERAVFGESRILTILETARRCATEANPDREDRLRRLDEDIARLTAERDRVAEGGDIEPATIDRMIDEYSNLQELLSRLPSDFMRVSEAVKEIHRSIISDFRADERRAGDVLDDYLQRAAKLMTGSTEGRAFTGAIELLRDDRLLTELKSDLDAILDHEFAVALDPTEKSNLRRTVTGIRTGIEVVLEERRRLSSTLRTHMKRHDALRDKELDEALRATQHELSIWMETAGPRAKAPLDLRLAQAEVSHLRERLFNPADHTPPPPLERVELDEDGRSFDDIRKQGGPSLESLRATIVDAVDRDGIVTTAELFDALPEDLRRPVEVLGLIHLAATGRGLALTDDTPAAFDTIRPDGQRRRWFAPAQVFTRDDLSDLDDAVLVDATGPTTEDATR